MTALRRRRHRIKLLSNEFWGFRSGTITKLGQRIFKIKRWAMGIQNSTTPDRRTRNYKNAKLSRVSAMGFVAFKRKGAKVGVL